jgi:hypothetical protein
VQRSNARPWVARREFRRPDPGRPACRGQWLATDSSGRRQALLKAHCPVSLELGGAGLDIEPADSHAHRRAVRHRTAGPAPPANSTPLVAVVIELVPSPAGPYRAGVARATRGEARAAASHVLCLRRAFGSWGGASGLPGRRSPAKKKPHEPSAPPESDHRETPSDASTLCWRDSSSGFSYRGLSMGRPRAPSEIGGLTPAGEGRRATP